MGAEHAHTQAQTVEECLIEQNWDNYTDEQHGVWKALFERQIKILKPRVCKEYLDGLEKLGITADALPDFRRMNERLQKCTGWRIMAVPGLISAKPFFTMLENRMFPSGTFIRRPDQMDYIEEPDIFHDVFGHAPLLTNPSYADYMCAYGKAGMPAIENKGIKFLARLNWYTIEFGLIKNGGDLKIYGAGICSSFGETQYALDDKSPHHVRFDLERILRTGYYIDDFQATYFVVDSFEKLFEECIERPFVPLYKECREKGDLNPFELVGSDIVLQKGTREYWKEFPKTKTKLK